MNNSIGFCVNRVSPATGSLFAQKMIHGFGACPKVFAPVLNKNTCPDHVEAGRFLLKGVFFMSANASRFFSSIEGTFESSACGASYTPSFLVSHPDALNIGRIFFAQDSSLDELVLGQAFVVYSSLSTVIDSLKDFSFPVRCRFSYVFFDSADFVRPVPLIVKAEPI